MTMGKKEVERLRKVHKEELAVLEAACMEGNATKDQLKKLTILRRKMK